MLSKGHAVYLEQSLERRYIFTVDELGVTLGKDSCCAKGNCC